MMCDWILIGSAGAASGGGVVWGKWLFAAVFAVLIVWLLLIPARRIGQSQTVPPWWRNVRFWAIFVATVQMLVYILWG